MRIIRSIAYDDMHEDEDCNGAAADRVWTLYSAQGCKQAVNKLHSYYKYCGRRSIALRQQHTRDN